VNDLLLNLQGKVQVLNKQFVVEVPKNLLSDIRIRPVKGTINQIDYKGWLTELEGSVYITLNKEWFENHLLNTNDILNIEVKVLNIGLPSQKVPKELLEKLAEKDIDIDILTTSEKQQLFSSVAESKTNEIREKRIEAIVNACILKSQRLKVHNN
jgi:hypothetical protein